MKLKLEIDHGALKVEKKMFDQYYQIFRVAPSGNVSNNTAFGVVQPGCAVGWAK
jgi:hypothetical protein